MCVSTGVGARSWKEWDVAGSVSLIYVFCFFFSSRRRHTRCSRDWSSDVCSSDLVESTQFDPARAGPLTSLVLEDSWSKGNIGPPGQETHGPPKTIGIWRLPVKDRSSKQQRATLPQEIFDSADGI